MANSKEAKQLKENLGKIDEEMNRLRSEVSEKSKFEEQTRKLKRKLTLREKKLLNLREEQKKNIGFATLANINKLRKDLEKANEKLLESNIQVIERFEKLNNLVTSITKFEFKVPPYPKAMEVSNFPKQLDTLKIKNLKEIKFPKIDLRELKKISTQLNQIEKELSGLKLSRNADDPLAVRLSDGENFYKALENAITQITGGGGGSIVEEIPQKITSNQLTVTTAGTRVQFQANQCTSVSVKANSDNTGNLFIGAGAVTSSNGFILAPGESVSLAIDNTSKLFADAATDGDGLSYLLVAKS